MILGVDIGGTAAKMAFVDREGHIGTRYEVSTCIDHYAVPVIDAVSEGIKRFLEKTDGQPEGIAVSAAGQIDAESGTVIGTNGMIPGYEGTKIAEILSARFGVPVTAINDADAAVLGECFAGKAGGKQNVILLTLGTGVGGGIVAGGKLYGGNRGIAGEFGHFTLYADGMTCTCGRKGCYECYASTSALVRNANESTGENGLNGKVIFERAENGDREMLAVLDRWTDDIAAGISGLVHIFAPETVLIGGGVSVQEKLLIEPLRAKVLPQLMPRFAEGLNIEAAMLGNDAGIIGAAAYWLTKFKTED